jgi:predicted neutral ceramidase superfamily lipid hydrolase
MNCTLCYVLEIITWLLIFAIPLVIAFYFTYLLHKRTNKLILSALPLLVYFLFLIISIGWLQCNGYGEELPSFFIKGCY